MVAVAMQARTGTSSGYSAAKGSDKQLKKINLHLSQYDEEMAEFFYQYTTRTGRDELYYGYFSGSLGNQEGKIAVDLGCGTGNAARLLTSLGFKVYGIDPSRDMLNQAKRHTTDGMQVIWREKILPNLEGKCSLVTAIHVHYHHTTERSLLDDLFIPMNKLLEENGTAIIIGCPMDKLKVSPLHCITHIPESAIPEEVWDNTSITDPSIIEERNDGSKICYYSAHDLPPFRVADGTEIRASLTVEPMAKREKERTVIMRNTVWNEDTLIKIAKKAGLEMTDRMNFAWRKCPDAYYAMRFKKLSSPHR